MSYPESSLPKPLKINEFYVLLALCRGSSHTYALRAVVRNDSLGSVVIPTNKLYGLVTAMHDEGLIELVGMAPAGVSGKPRNHYQISKYGHIRLQEEVSRLDHAVQVADGAGVRQSEVPTDIQKILLNMQY